MATPDQIAQLRLLIDEPNNVEPYTDEVLGSIIDANDGSLNASAGQIWRGKAASVAHLVDISEGGSSRKMSDMYKNFLDIAKGFEDGDGGGTGARVSRTRQAVRV